MHKIFTALAGLLLVAVTTRGQTYLMPEEGYKAAYLFPDYSSVGAFDLNDSLLFINSGDTIHCLDLRTGKEIGSFGAPGDYEANHYASFLTIHPDGQTVWAGYTSDSNEDDRIYSIDVVTGLWQVRARFPGNFDLEFWHDSILVSGLNSASWGDPNAIFILDTTHGNQHRKLIETGGNSAGIAVDPSGNLYYGTSFTIDPNFLVRWDSATLAAVINDPVADPLQTGDAEKLTDLPAGANDCHVDQGGNLVFNMNQFGSPKVLAKWNGTMGNGMNLDTIAVATGEWDWLAMVKSRGDIGVPELGNSIVTFSFGLALADLHTFDYHPFVAHPISDLDFTNTDPDTVIDLGKVFSDPDDPDSSIAKSVQHNSHESLLSVSIEGNDLYLNSLCECPVSEVINIVVEGVSGGLAVSDTFTVTLEFVEGIENKDPPHFYVYPNPSPGQFRVIGNWPVGACLQVFDLTGTLVYEDPDTARGKQADISHLPQGAYILRIVSNNRVFSKLIQKQ